MSTTENTAKKQRTSKSNLESDENVDGKQEESVEKSETSSNCTLTYDIWTLIFKYLNGRDLGVASLVCRTWKEAIESELALHAPQYLLTEVSDLKSSELKNIIEEIRVKPRVVFCFCQNGAQMIAPNVKYCLCGQLPRACDVIYIDTCVADLRTKEGIQWPIPEDADRVGCMFFPNLRDFDTKVFHHFMSGKNAIVDQSMVLKLSKNILKHNKNGKKCLIIFSDNVNSNIHCLLDTLKTKLNSNTLSLVGGRTHDLYVCKYNNAEKTRECKSRARIIAISIAKAGMESWSIIIKRNCYKEEQIVAKLAEFQKKIQLQKHTCAIMFGCCARKHNKDVEIGAFKKTFPTVPLICGYGNEEFGVDTLDYNPASKVKKRFYTNYSTIFNIITYS